MRKILAMALLFLFLVPVLCSAAERDLRPAQSVLEEAWSWLRDVLVEVEAILVPPASPLPPTAPHPTTDGHCTVDPNGSGCSS